MMSATCGWRIAPIRDNIPPARDVFEFVHDHGGATMPDTVMPFFIFLGHHEGVVFSTSLHLGKGEQPILISRVRVIS